MAENVTYLIGAGASAGKREKTEDGKVRIMEGLPCVAEIPARLEELAKYFENIKIPAQSILLFGFFLNLKELEDTRVELVRDLRELQKQSANHATIDTYARKLLLTGQREEFKRLEKLLSFYFIIEQVILPPDSRYDTFFANILKDNCEIPDQINVISWNYDSQFEIAYKLYNDNALLTSDKQSENFTKIAKIIKINGSATFQNMPSDMPTDLPTFRQDLFSKLENIVDEEKDYYMMERLLELYSKTVGSNGDLNETFLSFAFDRRIFPTKEIFERVNAIMEETKALVIIGYTFPFFNREIDRKILQAMKPDTNIYIQDLAPEKIKQNLQSVLTSSQRSCPIIPLKYTDQFALPPEL